MAKEKKPENSKKANKKPKSPDENLKINKLKITKKPKSTDENLKINKLKISKKPKTDENLKINKLKITKKPKSTDEKINKLKITKKPKSADEKLKINKLKSKKKPKLTDDKEDTIAEIVKKDKNIKKKREEKKVNKNKKNEEGYKFPQSRIRRIIKSDNPTVHISQDSVFLINKASEKFLELFCKEAYACATKEKKKKHVEYKHLSSVVSKQKRFDFLSDFVPEKVKAGVALAEISSAKT